MSTGRENGGMALSQPSPVDAYIEAAPVDARPTLRELAAILREAAPGATEAIKWRVPVWEGRRILYSLSAYKTHAAFMPTSMTLDGFRDEVEAAGLTTTPHMMQFPYGAPVPVDLVRRIAAAREEDVRVNDARWAG